MPSQQVVNNTSTQTTLTTSAGSVTTSPISQTVNGYSTLKTSIPFFSASMVGGIITVHNPEITTTGLTAGKDNLAYPASQISEITNVYSSFSGQTRKLSGSYDFSILMVQNSTTVRVAQIGGFKNSNDDTLGSFNVLLAKKPDDGIQWTTTPTNIDYYDTYIVNSFSATNNFTASYIQPLVVTQTENSSSFADIILSNIEPATGDVYKVKTLYKPSGQFGDFIDLGDTILERQDILIDTQSFETGITVGSYYENFGVFENLEEIQTYWTGSKVGYWSANTDIDITYDMDTLMGGARLKPTETSFSFVQAAAFSMKPAYNQRVYKDTEYIVTFNIANDPDIATYTHDSQLYFNNPRLDIYVSGSKITRSEDAFLNILANGASLLSNFNGTFNNSTLKQIDGGLGTRIGTYISKPVPGAVTSCAFRFKALEDASINLKFVIRYGAFIISDIHVYANKETGYSPNYVRISKRIPTEHLNTPLTFKFQYFDRFGRQANLESIAYGAVFDGDNTYIDGTNNLLTGSVFISNQVGSGLELAGVNSGYLRSVGYEGFISASNPAKGGAPGWMIFSGSVLPQSGDNYGGVGLELIADADNYLQYRTFPQSIFIVKAETFFLGASNNYISGSNGKLEISSSNFILSRDGDVYVKGDINADTGTFKDVDIRGKISTFQVSGSNTTSPNSGVSRVMLEPWYTGTVSPGPASTFYGLTANTYVSQSISNIKTRLPWYIPTYLWDPDTKTETISNRIQTASYGAVPAKQMDFEYNFSHDSTLYGITSGYPYDNGISFGYAKNITWNQSTGSWNGIRLENVRITPALSVSDEMVQKLDYVMVLGFSVYVGVKLRIIVKRGSTSITGYSYTDEFDTYEYDTQDGEHVTLRIPIGAQSSYRATATGYVPVNPRVDIEIQWRNNNYRGSVPNPSTDDTARFIALHELKILELPRVDNLAIRNLRIGDPIRSSVIFDVAGSNLIGTNGGAEPSMVSLRNTAFNVTQSKGYHDLKLRNLTSLGTITAADINMDGSLTVTNILATTLTGSLLGTATTASYVLNAVSSSFASTASYVTGSIHNSTNPALSASYAATASVAPNYVLTSLTSSMSVGTASYVNALNQVVTVGYTNETPSVGSQYESMLRVHPGVLTGGVGEGGQIMLAASGALGDTYSSASFIDTYQDQFRILKGTNVSGSNAGLLSINLQTQGAKFEGAVTASAYSGLPNSWLHATRNSSQTISTGTWANRDIVFEQYSNNNFTYNSSTGVATLKAGKTYRITARVAWYALGSYVLKFRVFNQTTSGFTGPTVEMIQSPNGTWNVSDNTLETIFNVGATDTDISIRTTSDTNAATGEYIRGDLNTQLIIQQIA